MKKAKLKENSKRKEKKKHWNNHITYQATVDASRLEWEKETGKKEAVKLYLFVLLLIRVFFAMYIGDNDEGYALTL